MRKFTGHGPRGYWDAHQSKYPHQITVPHLSSQDPNPRDVHTAITGHFLRVPFDGQSHWGFTTEAFLERFKSLYVSQS
jgi:hypothetical protein